MKNFHVLLVFALSAILLAGEESKPNVLFIVSDDHGWGDLPSNWDNTEAQLPVLDELAAELMLG